MKIRNSKIETSRRKAIIGAATGLSYFSISGKTFAKSKSRDDILKKAYKIREKTGKLEAFEDYILNRGFRKVSQNTETYNIISRSENPHQSTESSDGMSTQKYEKNDRWDLTVSVYLDGPGPHHAQADIDAYGRNDAFDCGEAPGDQFAIQWEHSDYDIVWSSWYCDSNSNKREATVNGCSFRYLDANEGCNQPGDGDAELTAFGGVDLKPDPGTTKSERSVILNYYHTWSKGSITDVSIGNNGTFTINPNWNAKKWGSPLQAYDDETDPY